MKLIELLNVMNTNEDIEVYNKKNETLFMGQVSYCISNNFELLDMKVNLVEYVVYRDDSGYMEITVE